VELGSCGRPGLVKEAAGRRLERAKYLYPMTDITGPGPIPGEISAPVHAVVSTGLRAVGTTIALVAIYYALPLDHTSTWVAAITLVLGLLALIALLIFQIRSIIRSQFPGLRAVEALATSLPLFLLLFSSTYMVMAGVSASNFGEKLTHTDALYFTVTVFTTTGFGDITAKSQGTRLLVTGQMIVDLVILGIGVKVILGAITRGRQHHPPHTE
jgi:voltage-gated potassium channel